MKTFLNIFFLFIACFFGNLIHANDNIYSTALEGDTTIMQVQGVQVLTDCAGVILDPGGYGDYPNNVQSTITIEAPPSTFVSLFFSVFHIENAFDDFHIYDGPSESSPLIGTYDNMELSGQTIVSTNGAITIVFDSDGSVFREGFVIDYLVAGGGDTPIADFEVSQTTDIPLNFPVSFTDLSQNAGTWLYNFGDGMESTEQNPTHIFTEPGTYEVSLTISNCSNFDTYTQTVTVQESGQLQLNPEEICVNLNSFSNTTVQVNLSNTGVGDLYYNFTEINNENPNSLTVILGTGIIPPGGTQAVNLFFSSGDLLGGTYIHDLLLQTGDINQAEIVYPVKMIVIGEPVIAISPNNISFPLAYLDYPLLDSMCITNLGTDTLHITDIIIDSPAFSVSPTQLSLAPEEEGKVFFTLLADNVGAFSGAINIFNNANTVMTATISGEVIDPPLGVFSPDDICLNLGQDESTLFIMGITNEGGENLDWNFDFINTLPDWLEITTLSGSLAPNASGNVPIIVNSTGLASGIYEYNATIATNDPIFGNAYLSIKLTVITSPTANFFPNSQNTCDGTIAFTDSSQGITDSWLWDFGDNTSSEEQNPIHTYEEEGIYDVSLITCNSAGCDTIVYQDLINFNTDDSNCGVYSIGVIGDTIITNCSGYIYDSGGPNGDYAANSNYVITISPPNAFAIQLIFEEFEMETGNWDFMNIYGGANTDAPFFGMYSGTEPPNNGEFFIFSESVTLEFISDGVIELSGFAIAYSCITPEAIADFSQEVDETCSNEVLFINNSLNATSYFWDFGDGNFSSEFSPIHRYDTPGFYDVSLVSNNSSSTSTITETVQIVNLPFDLDIILPANVYLNTPVEFSYNSNLNLSQVEWSTSSGNMSTEENPEFTFTQLGEVEISLIGIDNNNCQVVTTESFSVDELSKTNEYHNFSSFNVYPNPSQKIFNINLLLKESAQIELVLFNTLGEKLFEQKLPESYSITEQIDLSELTNGTYYLTIWKDGKYVKKHSLILGNK